MSGSVVLPTIAPTAREQAFFDDVMAAVAHAGSGTVVRCAGGWVRDKLLGLGSDDIDLAVDNMSGVQFAERLKAYLEHKAAVAAPPPPVADGTASAAVSHHNKIVSGGSPLSLYHSRNSFQA